MSADTLGDRMKAFEAVPRNALVPKVPVLLRLDGKAFHTLTRGMDKPVDPRFELCMRAAALALCEEVQGVQLAYVQSDEITLLLSDRQSRDAQGWFGYQVQKMCSVAASIATHAFSRLFQAQFPHEPWARAYFDCRAWNLPPEEVANCFIWRQQDATRNAIQGLGQAHFSHRELHGKSCAQIQELLFQQRQINFNDCPTPQKRGVCAARRTEWIEAKAMPEGKRGKAEGAELVARHRWVIDEDIPIFTQDRAYVERFALANEASERDERLRGVLECRE